ncbi:Hsp20/alpha crystallin family protein [Chitiniphilus purpureus]|uniref:Hsp20/alpha crystallin family protein n=1 Tax=Chitiniphilus purpureus TaxID=2981137 RepID=A0ABY6DHU6_9NEIS|nr:Hsp20/alpha crystallin family protein [Chitiniphilus sp. CD1]UXY13891.1 Hsp20/alpha crystallin family protein [Chitiniphilus sp. CD1]
MNHLVRRNLESLLDDPRRTMDELVRGFFDRPLGFEGAGQVRVDVSEDASNYLVHAELPGVAKEDIDVQIDGDLVSISAEVRRTSEHKDGDKVLRSERYYGRVSRSFRLGQDIDEGGAIAHFENGVLSLTLPKKPLEQGRRRLQIQ